MPTPGYVVNYSSNPNFYQNAFSGAVFDIGMPFHGAADAISAAHVRYDQYRGSYTSFDQHFVHNLDYAVFSVDPLTQNQRQFNAILYKRLSPDVEARLFFQLSTHSQGLSTNRSAADYANFTINAQGRQVRRRPQHRSVQQQLARRRDGLVQRRVPAIGPSVRHAAQRARAIEDEFRFFRYLGVPLKFQYRAGYGYNYNSYGLPTLGPGAANIPPTWGGVQYNMIFNTYLGATAYTNSVRLAKQMTISAKADELETWYTLPHHTITTDVVDDARSTPLSTKLPAFLLTYDVLNVGDF